MATTTENPHNEPIWMSAARRWQGTEEVAGAANNPVILGWAQAVGGWVSRFFKADSTPWCGLFVEYVLTTTGYRTPGDKSLAALSWQGWGQALTKAVPGAILVFKRAGGGHVGFYVAEDVDAYHVLGGNQSDKVCITRIAKARCVAIRWPYECPVSGQPNVIAANGTPLSANEA